MARRQLLTDEERQALLGIPPDADSLACLFTLSRVDRNLVAERRGDANRLGCAVQLALLRYPGTALAYLDQPPDALVSWMAGQLEIPAAAFAEYARRPQTMTDHARQLAATLRLRPPTMADLPPMIEAAADAARGTDQGQPIVAAVVAALRAAHIILPGAVVIERIAIAGRARARKRAADALVAGLSAEHLTKLDGLLVVEVNARYGHDPGLGFYTHVSDQHGPYSVRVMSATSHEAPYVLDGLMRHGTALRIGTHYTDTGGASDHVFVLCAMLGFRFCPRLRDLPDRKLATIEPGTAYKDLAPLIGRRIKADVIREHWGEILRLVASLQAGTVLPSAMLKRLAAFQRQNQLDLALQELGRVERTLFMLDWLESPDLRQRCQAGLNKSEQRHVLTQVICTFKQGRIADRGHEAQQFRASGLNLVIAAIVYWNSTYLADAVQHLRDQGKPVPDVLLAHTSPLTWEHIGFSGDFLWDRAAATADRRRPLNLGRNRIAA